MCIRRLLVLLAVTVLTLAVPAGGRAASASGDPTIVIAILATLSGPDALGPQDAADGFKLGMKQLTQRLGNQEARVVMVDGRGTADDTVTTMQRVLDHERVDFVLTALSPSAFAAVLPTLVEHKIFVLNLGQMPPSLAGAGCSPWVFDLAGPDDGLDEAAGVQLGLDQVKRLVVVALDSPLSAGAVAALKRTYAGEVVATLTPRHGSTTFASEIAELQKVEPEGVYDLLTGGSNIDFMRALDAAGLRSQMAVYARWPGFDRIYLPAMGEAALDAVTLGTWAVDFDNPASHRLVTEYEAEYGRSPTSWSAAGYDAAALLDAALKTTKGRTEDSEALRNALRHAEFASARGGFRFNTNQGPVLSYVARKVARDAKGRLSSEVRGVAVKEWHDRAATACPMRWDTAPLPGPAAAKKPAAVVPAGLPPVGPGATKPGAVPPSALGARKPAAAPQAQKKPVPPPASHSD